MAALLTAVLAILGIWQLDASAGPPRSGSVKDYAARAQPEPAPAVSFRDDSGSAMTLADLGGRLVVLNFWATWCAPCVREMPSLLRLKQALAGQPVTVVPLSQDRGGADVVRRFYDRQDLAALGLYVDASGRSAQAFGLRGLPTTVLIDAEGRELGRLEGAAEWDSPEALALIRYYLPEGVKGRGVQSADQRASR